MNHHTALLLLSIFIFRLILSWSFVGTSLEIVVAIAPAEQVGTVPHIYGGPEGPCPLPISTFPITKFEFSHYQLPILAFLITKFEFSHF